MRDEYDFSVAKKNPYAARLKTSVTIRLDEAVVGWFKELAEQVEIPYQTLINLYLRDCVAQKKKPLVRWKKAARARRA
jgi:uncharacterized protein (DUF4415 family)